MIQTKQFGGVLNLDDPDAEMPFLHHKEARNIVFRGEGANLRAQNIPGNVISPNPYLSMEGNNTCIGAWYDQVRGRIFSFIYNSAGNHGIFIYKPITGTWSYLILNGTNTDTDVLLFDIKKPILNVNILYGGSEDQDLLYWLNSQGKPQRINIDRAASYNPIKSEYIDVAIAPAIICPQVSYEDDENITVNNLRKKLFKFKVRLVTDDNEKSVTSIQTVVSLPYEPFNTTVDADPTKNARIAITYPTGDKTIKKIEILGAVSTGIQFSDFFLIQSIDKSEDLIPDDDIAVFYFYNDKAYNYIDIEESIQLFDWVPLVAVSQEILNGNVPIYANITEGYPNLMSFSNGTNTSNITGDSTNVWDGIYFSTLTGSQSGKAGFESGPIHVIVTGKVTNNNSYTVLLSDDSFFGYTATTGDDISDVMQGLIDDAVSKGFTVTGTSANPNFVYFSKSNTALGRVNLFTPEQNLPNLDDGSLNAYDWWSRYGFGLVYFDDKGRTNGAITTNGFLIETDPYSESMTGAQIPSLNAYIYHRPPDWATYYSWVRTDNLSKSTFLQWVSTSTIKEASDVPGEKSYAYISLEALNLFRTNNPQTPLSYSFTPNDRIRFIKRFNVNNTTANIYTNKDYEIQAVVTDPTVNGVDYVGQFVKIFLPATDASFDFGTSDYYFYFFELYTPAQPVASGLDIYYEYGERYLIGDATLSTRFHQGYLQNQSSDLVTPAITRFIEGDNYSKYRTIQAGTQINYNIEPGFGLDSDAGRITIGCTFVSQDIVDPNITPGSSPCNNLIGFNLSTDTSRQILTIGTGSYSFRIKGTISITFPDVGPDEYPYEFFLQKNDGTKYQLVAPFDAHNPGTYTFTVDTNFSMSTGERIFIFGWAVFGNDNTRSFNATNLTITRNLFFQQTCIDPNFSDYYPSSVNSNGRPFVYNENANTVNYPVLMRWSLAYQQDTSINQANRFYFQNLNTVDREKGSIQRLKARDRVLRIFQERACAQVGIYGRFIQNNQGQSELITTNEIITANNIQYYQGQFGIGLHPESLVSGQIQDYFVDYIRGYQLRLSNDGLTPISLLYKGQYDIRNLLTPYNNIWDRPDGSYAKILGVYDYFEEEYITVLQSGQNESNSIPAYTFSFNEKRNAYGSFRDYNPEWMVSAEDIKYGWLNGQMYIFNSDIYCNFFGVQYGASITCVFNQSLTTKKTWIGISEVSNTIWDCPNIYTNIKNGTGSNQQSTLIEKEFTLLEQMPSASFKRDMNSAGGKINGNQLKGNYIVIQFRKLNASELVYLDAVSVKFIDSPLTAI